MSTFKSLIPSLDHEACRKVGDTLHAKMLAMLDKADAGKRDLTANESKEYEALKGDYDALQAHVWPRAVNPSAPGLHGGAAAARSNRDVTILAPRFVNAFGGDVREAKANAYRAGKWVAAQLLKEPTAIRWCADNGLHIENAMSEGVATQGGYLVPDEMSTAIIRLTEEFGVARSEARVIGMSSDLLTIPRRTGGLTAHFIGENMEGAESDMAWGNVALSVKKLMILTRMSSEISEDAIIDLAALLTEEIALSFASKEDDCLFNGDGTSTYGGMYGITAKLIDGTHTAGAVDVATAIHDLFSEVDAADLNGLMAKCPTYALRNAKWYCSRTAYATVFQRIIAAGGGNTIADLVNGPIKAGYLGYPIVITDKLPNVTSSLDADVMLLFGDMRQAATMGARRDIRVALSGERYFELDQIGVKGTERFDVNAHDLGDNTTPGPIVGLIGSAS